jgi:dephospho-CoA kinase
MADIKIVGIGGMPRSGKDTLAELFIEAGFYGVSFGDIVRKFTFERHKDKPDPISVANMTETSNWLRDNHGADVVLREALRQFETRQREGNSFKGMVLWSIRAPVEVDFIIERNGQLIWVEASDEVRHKRAIANLRSGESEMSLEEFKRQEALQWKPQPGVPAQAQMDLSYVKAHSTIVFENNSDEKTEFLIRARQLIGNI